MPSIPLDTIVAAADEWSQISSDLYPSIELVKRVNIPINASTPLTLIEAITHDPFSQAQKYGLVWVFFGISLLFGTAMIRVYHFWGDRIRTALYKEELAQGANSASPNALDSSMTDASTARIFFPSQGPLVPSSNQRPKLSVKRMCNCMIAVFRWIVYRPVPVLRVGNYRLHMPSFNIMMIVGAGLLASLLYCFLPQPYFYATMEYGSPPLAVRAGMISVALMPWVVVLAMKANPISFLTGIGHNRLIVLHRWGAYLCTVFAIIHAVPYWYQSMKDPSGYQIFQLYFNQSWPTFTTGIAALAPLLFLTIHSLPILRAKMYELFVVIHIPISWAFIGLLFWHCNNYLTSWSYLYATVVIMLVCMIARLFFLNWISPLRMSWLIGEESAVTILPEDAVKVTVPTQQKWKPGQFAYLRMPGIAPFENHPFTITSLCSEDFPSHYGDEYRDMVFVFRPFGGFTKKVLETSRKKGPYKTYRSFIDGPYGGMQRQLCSFDHVVFVAGGSGITAIVSHLLDLIKRMREGRATTTQVNVIWAMKRPEIMEWFKEELRICREYAPVGSVHCDFFITSSQPRGQERKPKTRQHGWFTSRGRKGDTNPDNDFIASQRNSRIIVHDDSDSKSEDDVTALPQQAYLAPPRKSDTKSKSNFKLKGKARVTEKEVSPPQNNTISHHTSEFGMDETTTSEYQKSLMTFAVLPNTTATTITSPTKNDGWRTEYGRPDIPYMLKNKLRSFSKKTCVYVCGPPELANEAATTVAEMQRKIWNDPDREEIYLHSENYAL